MQFRHACFSLLLLYVANMKIMYYHAVFLPLVGSLMLSSTDSEILTIKDVAEYLKVTERTIYRLAAAKKIPGFKVGGMWRFRQADIDGWIAAQADKPETK
jgi:excisionase family DNA binding protein